MSLKNVKELEKSRVELEIEVNAEDFEKSVAAAFKKNSKKIQVPGFRKGKAPRKMVEKLYGEGVFYEDAVNDAYPKALEEAIKEADIKPVDRGDLEVVSVGKEGLVFKAVFTVTPEVKLGKYKDIEAEKVIYTVSDEEIAAELERARQRGARIVTKEGEAALGDIVDLDYEGFVDGVAFAGGKGENQELTLGSGQFIPGFEDQLVSKKAGDECEVNVTFPEDYHEKSLAGKEALFKCKVNEVKVKELPELDDEFVKDISESDTLEDYKKEVKQNLQSYKDRQAENDFESALIDEIIAGMTVEVPDAMIENQIDNFVSEYQQKLQMQGLDFETYLKYTGSDVEQFRKAFRDEAEKRVKIRLALEEIVKAEKIVISDEDIENEYKSMAEQYKMEIDQIKKFVPSEEIAKDISVGKAIELVKANAVVKEVPFEEKKEEKPAPKKTAAKKTSAKKSEEVKDEEKTETKKTAAKKPAAKKTSASSSSKTTTKKTTTKKAVEKKEDKAE